MLIRVLSHFAPIFRLFAKSFTSLHKQASKPYRSDNEKFGRRQQQQQQKLSTSYILVCLIDFWKFCLDHDHE